jgi:type IV pilus assembly protein PilC
MPATATYQYEVVDPSGRRSKGTIEATSEESVAQVMKQQGATLLSVSRAGTGLQREIAIPGLGSRTTLKDLSILARQFATMTQSGLSLLRSLAILEEQTEKPGLKKAIRAVHADVGRGLSLSAALGKQDKTFPSLMVAMIRAGETGGFLDSALDRIATTFEKDANLRAKIKSAMTYPTIVLFFAALMIAGVLIFIVPIFEKMFRQLGGKLPAPTQVIVNVSHQIWWLGPLLIGLTIAGTIFTRHKLRTDQTWRLNFDRFKLRIPVFGKLFTKIAISRFARNLGTLLGAGVPVLQALDVVGGTTGNAVIGAAMKDVAESVREGRTMSEPLHKHPIFPAMVTQMMEVGEESGQTSAMLEKVATFYDREVDVAAEALTAAIEPIMVVFMGAVVGTMVICLYLPMFTIGQHIQGAQ